MEMAKKVFRPDIYQQAAEELIAEGVMSAADFPDFETEDGVRSVDATRFIDGHVFDAQQPNQYLEQFEIGLKADATP